MFILIHNKAHYYHEMSDFYLTLPSNSSLDIFPSNTLTRYVVKLEQSIDLSKYVVGLVEMQYPVSWHNVSDAYFVVNKNGIKDEDRWSRTVKLRTGKYDTIKDLVREIQKSLENYHLQESLSLFQDQITRKIIIVNKDPLIDITFNESLLNILGVDNKPYAQGLHHGLRQCDIDEGQTAFYVYSNIIQHQYVGDTLAPLLRVVPIRGKERDTYRTEEFRHVMYVPTINSRTDIIEIDIRRDDGQPVSFQTGKVVITLHFKEIS